MYLISLIALFFVAAYLNRGFSILIYGSVHVLALSAGIMFELTILTRKFWKEGFAVGNIYSRLTTYILTLMPGFALVLLPIIGAFMFLSFAESLVLPVFLAMASSEFAVMTAIVAIQK